MREHSIIRAGARLCYRQHGNGNPAVVLLQGLGLGGRMWFSLPSSIAQQQMTALVPDSRGTGESELGPLPLSMGKLADDVAAIIEHSGFDRAIVAGISFGGMVAQHVALRHPERVSGLLLAATTCGIPYGHLPQRSAAVTLLRSCFDASPVERALIIRRFVHPNSLLRNPRLFRAWDAALAEERTAPTVALWQLGAVLVHNTGSKLSRISCPTEVISGDHDEIIPYQNSETLATRIPRARLTLLKDAGHVFPLEQPNAMLAAIERLRSRVADGH